VTLLQVRGKEPALRYDNSLEGFIDSNRPPTASAMTQASFHALLLKKVLSGELSLTEWGEQTHDFSSILIESGRELGKILVTDRLPVSERTHGYMQAYLKAQAKLNVEWNSYVGTDSKADTAMDFRSKSQL
jgi:hypothetical protein